MKPNPIRKLEPTIVIYACSGIGRYTGIMVPATNQATPTDLSESIIILRPSSDNFTVVPQ